MIKKIVHFHPNGAMGSIFVGPLVDFERKNGYESTIVTSSIATKYGGVIIPYDLRLENVIVLPYAFIKLCIYLYINKPNLIISHNARSSLLPLLAARLLGVKRCVYFNHGVPTVFYKGLVGFILKCIEVVVLKLASEVVTVSHDMKKELSKINSKVTISLISNGSASGINLDLFEFNSESKKNFRARYLFSDDDFLVVFIGRPEVRKGFLVALNLMTNFFANSHYKLIMCGPTEADVKDIINMVPKNIICLGFTNNVPEVLANANCLILPSNHEGLSYAVLEAMASRCLPIANKIPGVSELISHGLNGFLIPKNEIADYARSVLLIEGLSHDKSSQMKEAAQELSKKYSRVVFMESYNKYLIRMLDAI